MVGAPGSIERTKEEFPKAWPSRLSEDQLLRLVQGSNPSHRMPVWVNVDMEEPPSYYEPAWELGELERNGCMEFFYAVYTKIQGTPYPQTVYFREPLPKYGGD